MEHQLKCDIDDLKDDLHESKTEANYLRQYKLGYDDLQAGESGSVDSVSVGCVMSLCMSTLLTLSLQGISL